MGEVTPPRPLAEGGDCEAFDCGRESLNRWFRRNASRNQESGVSRTSVICDPAAGRVVGFVSLSASQIERAFVARADQRNRPDPLPALLLGQLAVDQDHQGRGYARSLMLFALTTAVRLSRSIGCFCVLAHPLDDGVRDFYRRHGFEDLPFDSNRSMAVRIIDLVRNGFGADG